MPIFSFNYSFALLLLLYLLPMLVGSMYSAGLTSCSIAVERWPLPWSFLDNMPANFIALIVLWCTSSRASSPLSKKIFLLLMTSFANALKGTYLILLELRSRFLRSVQKSFGKNNGAHFFLPWYFSISLRSAAYWYSSSRSSMSASISNGSGL